MTQHRPWHRLLVPLTPLYRGVISARLAAYRRGWLKTSRLQVPVVSVGNLTLGGTGKTPTVIALVRDLVRRGRHPAVLTRGYGRSSADPLILVGPDPQVSVQETGDEPLELAARLPGVPVVVDHDRVRGGIEAQARGADVLVLDDGFQHLRLERDLDVVLVDAGDPWGGGKMPPRGRLREPVAGLGRAHAVLVTKVGTDPSMIVAEIQQAVDRVAPGLPVLSARLEPKAVRRGGELVGSEMLEGRRILATAGLGRPEGFADLLRTAGAEVVETSWFADHHPWTRVDVEGVVQRATELDAVAVTTAKDAVKMPRDSDLWVVEAAMVSTTGDWDGLWRLLPEVEG